MGQIITSPEKFALWFNSKAPGAYRRITAQDIRLLTECSLIGRYGYYGNTDLETVRGILQYEQLREKTGQKPSIEGDGEQPRRCKRCGRPLSHQGEGKQGRPREYCPTCQSSRATERYRKWRAKRKLKQKAQQKSALV